MVTRHDVAVLAGTSDAVVSYVVNRGPRNVADATRERVLAAMETLGYRPNAIARTLAAQRSFTLGLIVPDISNPFFAELASALENAALDENLTLLFGNAVDDEDRERMYVRALVDRQVDGLLVVPVTGSPVWLEDVGRAAVPTVVLDRAITDHRVSSVVVDNATAAMTATSHLIEHGHSLVGCIAGPTSIAPAAERARGWAMAMDKHGLYTDPTLLAQVPFGRAPAALAARQMLTLATRPTAIFVASDEQAAGVYKAAAQLGLRMPEDLAVGSFDGIAGGTFNVPSLTTMQQPIAALAKAAIEMLVARIADPTIAPESRTIPSHLVIRRSCGCPESEPAM